MCHRNFPLLVQHAGAQLLLLGRTFHVWDREKRRIYRLTYNSET